MFSGWLALSAIAGVKGASRSCRKAAMSFGTVESLSARCRYLQNQWALLSFKVSVILLGVAPHSKSNESAEVLPRTCKEGCTGDFSGHSAHTCAIPSIMCHILQFGNLVSPGKIIIVLAMQIWSTYGTALSLQC